ncbi:MAG: DMT family transporter [Spirochaetales bacterium]|nr:DMT family transporter [Spirochaetales bacterium]
MNLLSVTFWSIAPAMVHYVKDYYTINFQNFSRYLISLILLWPFFFLSNDRKRTADALRRIPSMFPKLLIISGINYLFQETYTFGIFKLLPGIFTLILQSGIIFSVLFAFIFFADERRTLKNKVFIIGLIGAVSGVILTIAGGKNLGRLEISLGILFSLISAASWSLLGTLIKKWLPDLPASLSIAVVFTVVTPLFLATYIISAGGFIIPKAPISIWALMLLSGFIGVGLGQSLYYRAVPVLGISTASSLGLLTPFLAGLVSYFVFSEMLTALQLAGGILLIVSSYFIIKIRFRHI